ncbi:DUF5333 domain-containing protein [Roseovarius nanhaiticus]|uniref:DUF5333 domain-containing protein n=1 Tax=Roseovarius nanhaiticus TaxID=573024 RepID=UPI002490EF1A|nr:DUF5333 domain-containing protein [Roseovarius nanhaiticus]
MSAIHKVMIVLAMVVAPAWADAKPPLHGVHEIDDAMLWVALAIEISNQCDTIDPRTLKGLSVLYGLKSRAEKLGYTDAEISAYVKSPEEKARMRKRGEAYVRSRGLDPAQPDNLCTLGQAEIARQSSIGRLLRER